MSWHLIVIMRQAILTAISIRKGLSKIRHS